MADGGIALAPATRDFRLQHGDTGIQLRDRQRIEILLRQRRERVVRPFRKSFFRVHGRIVDRRGGAVNKPGGEFDGDG